MLVLVAVLLALIPAVAVIYPFVRRHGQPDPLEREASDQADLMQRWDATVAGLKNAELEWAIGNLAADDYRWLRRQYMVEAAQVMRAMDLEEDRRREFRASVDLEIREVRARVLGQNGETPVAVCPRCSSELTADSETCPSCGGPAAADAGGHESAAEETGE